MRSIIQNAGIIMFYVMCASIAYVVGSTAADELISSMHKVDMALSPVMG